MLGKKSPVEQLSKVQFEILGQYSNSWIDLLQNKKCCQLVLRGPGQWTDSSVSSNHQIHFVQLCCCLSDQPIMLNKWLESSGHGLTCIHMEIIIAEHLGADCGGSTPVQLWQVRLATCGKHKYNPFSSLLQQLQAVKGYLCRRSAATKQTLQSWHNFEAKKTLMHFKSLCSDVLWLQIFNSFANEFLMD